LQNGEKSGAAARRFKPSPITIQTHERAIHQEDEQMSGLLLVASFVVTGVFLVVLFKPAPFSYKLEGKRVQTPAGSSVIDRSYFGSALWLSVLAIVYVATALALISEVVSSIAVLVALGLTILAVFVVFLAVARIFGFPETRYLHSHKLLSNHTYFTLPHDVFTVRTEDGVRIRGMSMTKGRKQAIVLCHAGFRTMNTLADVAVAEWLFDDFDIFAFDFRGHGNSGGWYSGDGKTCLDLKAVLQYIKANYHFDKIGLMGRSIGAWTIIMKEAREPEADSILAAALPNHQIRDCPPLTPLYPIFVNNRPGNIVARIARGLRPRPYEVRDDPWKVIDQISPTPMLMVYCEKDSFLGMSREGGMDALFERAKDPKRLVYFPGDCHVYEVHLMHKYYALARDWFIETLK
jgi:hypothetical protein